jgi:glycerol uptake facilitator-like aquaporin
MEVIASFFLVFMYLCSTDAKTKFTKDAAIQTIILSGSYLGAMMLAGTNLATFKASPVNPAVAFGLVILNISAENLKGSLIYILSPFGGSVLALLFFRFIYKKTQEQVEMEEDEHNSAGMMEQNEALLNK